ncbi:type II secretion system minor pseudopilin GspI [Pseudoxanthomonas spadix]|uniref:Type II secretion system protein I n=1 Tax=Pseudoxanthomonas spadix (strain BD-a59) TaxID=1045855 RepID=G7UPM9_PSEUP|nr:type II secretion system minor pseudopilin GspI [Pseudoxanthomonas spadix]AER56842.1 type II secretion system protein I [Pseudoxanthomonas spadix BD-a59]RMW98005.1 type II secretion system protein GspI [Pseudoxanthomonas spadix]
MRCATEPHHARFAMRGFSLIELLVALAVFALAVLALLNLAGESTRTAVLLEERVLAGVVAENRAVESMIEPLERIAAEPAGTESAGDLQWQWSRTVQATEEPGIVRIDIRVQAQGRDQALAVLSVLRETGR